MARLLVLANEATAAQRRVYFHLVDATDGLTAETGEAGGQPQVSSDGGAWTNTGIGTLNAIGNGRYYADLTQTLVQTTGTLIETRYKSANTAECPGDSVQVVAFDPNDTVRLGLTALPNAAAEAAGGLITRGSGTGQLAVTGGLAAADLQNISGSAAAAENCQLFFDGTGYTGTNNVIGTVTTVTNQLTAAQIATGVWQDSTAGDFTAASSIGKALYVSNVAPGAAGGHMISGSNAGTTTFGAFTVTGATTYTGNVSMAAGLTVAQSSLNSPAILVTGNGTAAGIDVTGGATGDGILVAAGGGSGRALHLGSITVDGTSVLTGAVSMGSTFTVTGGIVANVTGNITGNLVGTVSTLTTYTGNTPQTGDCYARLGAPAGASMSADVAAVKVDTAATLVDTNELQTDWTNGGRLDLLVDSILDDTGTSGVAIATATAQVIADETLKRGVSSVEDTANTTSLAAIILAILESSVSGTTWTIRKTGGTTFVTKTITTDAGADPITGVT